MSLNLILASEFDINLGPAIKQQYPSTTPLLKDQLSFLSEIVIPDQLHNKSVDKEDFTLFPVYRDEKTGTYKYTRTDSRDEQLILFTVCNYKYDTSINRNYLIKSLSIVTRLPFFINLKPIMIMLLENYFQNEEFEPIIEFYNEINNHSFMELCDSIKLDKLQRVCYLEYLKQNEFNSDLNKFEIVFGPQEDKILKGFNKNKDSLEVMIPVVFQKNITLKIPFRISLYSLLGSNVQFFGYNLDHDNVLKSFFNTINNLTIYDTKAVSLHKELFPLELNTTMLIVIINAILTGKKIVVMSYTKPIMNIIEFILAILILLQDENETQILGYNSFPYFDISKMDLLKGLSHYIIGTTNPIFKEISDDNGLKIWDLLIDLDANQIHISDWESSAASRHSSGTSYGGGNSPVVTGTPSAVTDFKKHRSIFPKGMRFPSFKKLNKRNSINSADSNSSLVIDEYLKDDYSVNETEVGTYTEGADETAFKFDFEKVLLLSGSGNSSNIPIDDEINDDNSNSVADEIFVITKVHNLNKQVAGRQDDILIYIYFIKHINFLGYDLIFKNLSLSFNLNKLINYRTFKYESEFKGMTSRNNLQDAFAQLEKSVIKLNNEQLTIPYNFNIFQFGAHDKEILEFHNARAMDYFKFIKAFKNLRQHQVNLEPTIIENDLKYSVNVSFYIQKFFQIFSALNAVTVTELQAFLTSFRSILYATNDILGFFFYLISITRKIKFGSSAQDLNFIQVLIILQKFIKTNDDCNLEINKILYKFKEQWYCSQKIDELITDFVD